MSINGPVSRYVIDGLFVVLIGTFGWVANKADIKVEKHEVRIQASELSSVRVETKLDYAIKSLDEIKDELKKSRQ